MHAALHLIELLPFRAVLHRLLRSQQQPKWTRTVGSQQRQEIWQIPPKWRRTDGSTLKEDLPPDPNFNPRENQLGIARSHVRPSYSDVMARLKARLGE